MRVFINPIYTGADRADGGIRRVSDAQVKYLPEFDWQVTNTPDDADLIVNHGAGLIERPGVPMVASCHGLMWASYGFGAWGDDVNKHVIEVLTRANAITAPSRWVAHAISRGMLAAPTVVYHGVDVDEWAHNEQSLGYVLWNKARADQVSDPRDMNDVAALLPSVPFLSTFGQPTSNVQIIGAAPYEQMRPVIQRAGCYLATARETFGIGTLEALAAGVPVAGWRYGGQEEIIIEGETGYLAPYGDYQALAQAITRCLQDRDRLSRNCVQDARERWGWRDKIQQYAQLYTQTLAAYTAPRPKVSVVVTCHNLGRYLKDALVSVGTQTMVDFECLIVDDQSTDDTEAIGKMWASELDVPDFQGGTKRLPGDRRFRYLKTPTNLKLSGARNYGWQHANGKYVLFLDADDLLAPNALDTLSGALDKRSEIHIAYGGLDTVNDQGGDRKRNPWPAGEYNWHAQIAHLNQPHGACLMRREVLERSGGYRVRDWRAEDASFWARVTSFGFRAAKVTDDTIQIYRLRSDSKSRGEDGDGDWTAWLPWRLAGDPRAGVRAIEMGAKPNPQIVPFGAQGAPPAPLRAWPVHHHQEPAVSVIIPVGPGHARYLIDALDSVQAQTMPFWEAVVVMDGQGAPPEIRQAHPWARFHLTGTLDGAAAGAGHARNIGLQHARAPLVLFLDADDVLTPRALEVMLKAYTAGGGKYVYSDWLSLEDDTRIDGQMQPHEVEDYDPRKMLQGLRHAVTALVPIEWVKAVGGFDEQLQVFEDWDLFCKLAIVGYCGVRAPEPLLIYRRTAGMRTRAALRPRAEGEEGVPAYTELGEQAAMAIADRYTAWRTGEEPIMACCSGNSQTVDQAGDALADMLGFAMMGVAPVALPENGLVRIEFIGDAWGAQSYVGPGSGRVYRAGRDPQNRYHDADPRDLEHLVNRLEKFRIVGVETLAQAAQAEDVPVAVVEPRVQERRGGRRR